MWITSTTTDAAHVIRFRQLKQQNVEANLSCLFELTTRYCFMYGAQRAAQN